MTDLQLTFRGMSTSPSVVERIEQEVARLARHGKIERAHVTIEAKGDEHPTFAAHVMLSVPHAEVVANREVDHEDSDHANVWKAIDQAFSAARRQLEDLHDRRVARRRNRVH